MISQKLDIKSVVNIRDLGGIKTKDGKTIKEKRLIRSGGLKDLTKEELDILVNEYNLKIDYDFRSPEEKGEFYDKIDERVRYVDMPALSYEESGTITRDEKHKILVNKFLTKEPIVAHDLMVDVYKSLARGQTSINAYRNFLLDVINNQEGSILWHCSLGKDRAGVGTILVLSLLGVDEETIIEDYYATNYFLNYQEKKQYNVEDYFNYCFKEYIEAYLEIIKNCYGGFDNYLKNVLNIDEEMILKARRNYLK